MFIIDTNIFVSEILVKYEQDELTQKYRTYFQQIPLTKRVVTDFILGEFELLVTQVVPSRYKTIMDDLEKKALREIISAHMERIIKDYTLISPSQSVIKTAFDMYKQFEKTHYISFTDSLLLATAKNNDYTLLTKDLRLHERAKELNIAYYEPNSL